MDAEIVSTRIVVPDDLSMVALLGSRDELLAVIETALVSDVHVRGNEITITGSAVDNALATSIASSATTANPGHSSGTTYDQLGRVQTYTDGSTGGGTVTTLYDTAGRVASVTDAKGTTSWAYNSSTEHRGLPTSETVDGGVGTWTATYDADGAIATQSWPNGLVQTWTRDSVGAVTQLVAVKAGSEWLRQTVSYTGVGQAGWDVQRVDTTGAGVQQVTRYYAYDRAGRLATVGDVGVTGACTTRTYGFDADSNRLRASSYPAGSGGSCSTATTPTTVGHAYDTADRLLGNGVDLGLTYDAFGRITTLPGADTPAGGSTPVTATFYADDQARSLTQGSSTVTFGRDAAGRIANRVNGLGQVQVENHYDSAGTDSPDWITEDSNLSWTRNITDLSGGLAATITQAGSSSLTWQIANLHGDITTTGAKPDRDADHRRIRHTADRHPQPLRLARRPATRSR